MKMKYSLKSLLLLAAFCRYCDFGVMLNDEGRTRAE